MPAHVPPTPKSTPWSDVAADIVLPIPLRIMLNPDEILSLIVTVADHAVFLSSPDLTI